MDKHFKAIVEKGYQILQTPGGERVSRIKTTCIFQGREKVGECVFDLYVNYKSSDPQPCKYDPDSQKLTMSNGEVLPVEILEYKPEVIDSEGLKEVALVKAKCTVVFPYETGHKNFVPDDLKMIV